MTAVEFSERILRDLGQLLAEVSGIRAAAAVRDARHDERHGVVLARLDKIEGRLDKHDARAEETGRHSVADLKARIAIKDSRHFELAKLVGTVLFSTGMGVVVTWLGLR